MKRAGQQCQKAWANCSRDLIAWGKCFRMRRQVRTASTTCTHTCYTHMIVLLHATLLVLCCAPSERFIDFIPLSCNHTPRVFGRPAATFGRWQQNFVSHAPSCTQRCPPALSMTGAGPAWNVTSWGGTLRTQTRSTGLVKDRVNGVQKGRACQNVAWRPVNPRDCVLKQIRAFQ